jgi:succinate dehydrogenase hydrophobic anchor subunit
MSTLIGITTILALILVPSYLVWMLVKTIRQERRSSNLRKVLPHFSLGIVVCGLFFVSWTAHGFAEWRKFAQDQENHHQPARAGEFVIQFGEATLQNWQSEFLEAFGLIVLTAAYVHRGSAESKDSEDRIESKIDRIMEKLDA